MNFVIISSTGGGVLGALLGNGYFRNRLRCVASDRHCGAIERAARAGIPTRVFETTDGLAFSNFLLEEFADDPPDLFVAFYTRLLRGRFLKFAKRKLVNIHPSILPIGAGFNAFEKTLRSNSRFIGSTAHLIDEGMDSGCPIIQSAAPYDPHKTIEENRHTVFIQQCKILLQVIKYYEEERLEFDAEGRPSPRSARYEVGEFSPNLDSDLPWHALDV
jgi:phosphoribosylglycinamide formyltransferase 1